MNPRIVRLGAMPRIIGKERRISRRHRQQHFPRKIDLCYRNAPPLERFAASGVVIARFVVVAFVLNQRPRSLCAGHNPQSAPIHPYLIERDPRIASLLRCQMPIERILVEERLTADSAVLNQRLIGETFNRAAEQLFHHALQVRVIGYRFENFPPA